MKAKKYTKETILQLGVVNRGFPRFDVGDTVAVVQKIKEGDKERLQTFQGDVIAMRNRGISSTFTVRKIGAGGIAVERIFPYYSPMIESLSVPRRGRVRRAKLYYLRSRKGTAARVQERVLTREERERRDRKAEATATR